MEAAAPTVQKKIVKRRRRRKRDKALREIMQEQNKTGKIIPRAPMKRNITDILVDINPEIRITKEAFDALTTDAEHKLIELFHQANALAIHAGRQTVSEEDLRLAVEFNDIQHKPNIFDYMVEDDQSPSLI